MTRKERSASRSDFNAYREWSDQQYKDKGAIVVTETDRTPVQINWGNTTRSDAHNEKETEA